MILFKPDRRFLAEDGGGMGGGMAAPADATPAPDVSAEDPTTAEEPVAEANEEGEQTVVTEAEAEPVTEDAQPDRVSFEDLIAGEYKDEYQKRVQAAVQDRLKGSKAREEKLAPIIAEFAKRYGKEADDIDGIREAFDNDASRTEQQALDQGISPDIAKRLAELKAKQTAKKQKAQAEAEAQQAKAQQQMRDEMTKRHFDSLQQQAERMKEMYPGFDLQRELANEKFFRATTPEGGLTLEEAYMAVHGREILSSGMQYAVNRSAQKVAASVQANGRRPSESGIRRTQPVEIRSDPSKYTKAEREEIRRRVALGEKIVF